MDHKRTSQDLFLTEFIESGEGFRRIFEDASIGMTVIGLKGSIRLVNQAFLDFIGYEEDEILQMTVPEITHPDDRARTVQVRQDVIRTGSQANQEEKRYIRKDGKVVWGLLNRSVVKDESGETLYTIGQVQDITDKKLAEINLRESEQRLRDYVTSAADRYWETDADHRFVYVSDVAFESNRFDSDLMVGHTRWELDEMEPDAEHWRQYKAILDSHEPFRDFEYVRLRPSGTEFRIRTSGIPIFDDDGNFLGYRGVNREISRDITARELAEEEARVAQQRMFDAMEKLDAGFVLWDKDNKFVYCNSYFRELQGDLAELLVPGASHDDFLRQIAGPRKLNLAGDAKEEWLAKRKAELSEDAVEYDVQMPDGRWYRVQKKTLDDGSRVSVHTDVTNRKNIEKLKDEFVSLASHELRTPLTSIKGALGILRQGIAGDLPESSREMIEIAARNSDRLSQLVEDFLDISKIESGEMEFDFKTISVSEFVSESVELNSNYAEQFGSSIDVTKVDDGLKVRGDHSRLSQVMANLISNAAKFSPEGEPVTLSVEKIDSEARFSVADRGAGIPVQFRDKIWDKFTQADSADSKSKYGTGLGLSIAKEIVEVHGGEIWFEPNGDQGTIFYFDIPLAAKS